MGKRKKTKVAHLKLEGEYVAIIQGYSSLVEGMVNSNFFHAQKVVNITITESQFNDLLSNINTALTTGPRYPSKKSTEYRLLCEIYEKF